MQYAAGVAMYREAGLGGGAGYIGVSLCLVGLYECLVVIAWRKRRLSCKR